MVSYAGRGRRVPLRVALVDTISFPWITAVLGALCTGGAVVASRSPWQRRPAKVALTGTA